MEHPNTQINEVVVPHTQMNQQQTSQKGNNGNVDNSLKEVVQQDQNGHGSIVQTENTPQISFVHTDLSQLQEERKPKKKGGRRKINIEYITDKNRRHITFSKRKGGIMKKAYELSTLTGTQVILLVASETGHVYTFATPKLQPIITKPEGKNLIQQCLNSSEDDDSKSQEQQQVYAQDQVYQYQYGYQKFPVMNGMVMRGQYEQFNQYPPEYQQQLQQEAFIQQQLYQQQQQQQEINGNVIYQVNGNHINGENGKK